MTYHTNNIPFINKINSKHTAVLTIAIICWNLTTNLAFSSPANIDLAGNSSNLTQINLTTLDSGMIFSSSGTPDLTLNINADSTLNGNIANSINNVIKTGLYKLTITGNNEIIGDMTITEGIINISQASKLGSGNLILNGGTLQVSTSLVFSKDILLNSNSSIDLNGFNVTFSGKIDTNGYNLTINNSAFTNNTATLTGTISGLGSIESTSNGLIDKSASRNMIPYSTTTFAGSTNGNHDDNTGTNAQFFGPYGITADSDGNLYVADTWNTCIRKINIETGAVTTLAGSTEGYVDAVGQSSKFSYPCGIVADTSNNLYVADLHNHAIRKIKLSSKEVTTIAGGTQGYENAIGIFAKFDSPMALALDLVGNLYIADTDNNRIRAINLSTGAVSTLAGSSAGYVNDIGENAKFFKPCSIVADTYGNLYVADTNNHKIRKIVISTGAVSTLAGSTPGNHDDTGLNAQFNYPCGLTIDNAGNLFIADSGNQLIRKIVIETGVVTTIAGRQRGNSNNLDAFSRFNNPNDVTTDTNSNLYIADTDNNLIRKISHQYDLNGSAATLYNLSDDGIIKSSSGTPTLTLNNSIDTTFKGIIQNTITNLIKNGNSVLILSGINNINGSTTISDGTLIGNISQSSSVIINNGSYYDLNGSARTLNNISGYGTIKSSNTNAILTLHITSDKTFDGTFSNTIASLIKTGDKKLILSGTNNISGNTTISDGIINVSTEAKLGSGSLVLGGGTLQFGDAFTFSKHITLNANSAIDINGNAIIFSGDITTAAHILSFIHSNGVELKNITLTGDVSGNIIVDQYCNIIDKMTLNENISIHEHGKYNLDETSAVGLFENDGIVDLDGQSLTITGDNSTLGNIIDSSINKTGTIHIGSGITPITVAVSHNLPSAVHVNNGCTMHVTQTITLGILVAQ